MVYAYGGGAPKLCSNDVSQILMALKLRLLAWVKAWRILRPSQVPSDRVREVEAERVLLDGQHG